MIANPYNEAISLHDMSFKEFKVSDNKAYISLNQAYLITAENDYSLENPSIIIHDLIKINNNEDYPIRIKLFDDEKAYNLTVDQLSEYNFYILEEAYGIGLVHFYGLASLANNAYECTIDIHYGGELEVNWDDKISLEI